jgi:TIR domain
MHRLTEIEIAEKRRLNTKKRQDEWQKIIRGASAAGNLMSGNTVINYLNTGFDYIDKLLNDAYAVETSALVMSKTIQADEYFMNFKDELFKVTEEESGIVQTEALRQFRSMGESIQRVIIAEASSRAEERRKSIMNHAERIKEQIKLELSHDALIRDPLVFISYDTRDIELAHAIAAIIKRVFTDKVTTFIAKRDIKAGNDAFKTMLHDNLAKSAVVLALCTKRSLTSPWLWFESGAGFGSCALIPIWAGIKPLEFKAPMTIFQGRSIEDKAEVQDVLTRIAGIVQINIDNNLTAEEFDKLLQISKNMQSSIDADGMTAFDSSAGNQVIKEPSCPNCSTIVRPFFMSPIPNDFVEIENATHECSKCKFKTRIK